MIKFSNGETSFSLTYGTKAMIPVEIGMPTLRTAEVDMEAKSKAKMEKYYNARVRNTSFKPGNLVYQNHEAKHAEDGGKLRPKWEGPYEVTKALVLKVVMPISIGITASVPYVSENGVSPLLDFIIVWCAHKTCEISSSQFLFLSSNRVLIPSPKLLFSLSTKPLACGCLMEAKH
nr:reverse transcriptase domain-containing protein [Tanacetum cinerariifolium]